MHKAIQLNSVDIGISDNKDKMQKWLKIIKVYSGNKRAVPVSVHSTIDSAASCTTDEYMFM